MKEGAKFCPKCGAEIPGTGASKKISGRTARRLNIGEIFQRPEVLIAIAGVLMLIGAFGPWISGVDVTAQGQTISVDVYNPGWRASMGLPLITGLMMLFTAAMELGYVNIYEDKSRLYGASTFLSVWILILAVAFLVGGTQMGMSMQIGATQVGAETSVNYGWGIYLAIIASFIGLISAYKPLEIKLR